jgi:hypothetical protein
VVAVYRRETCCVYIVRSAEGQLVELKWQYVCCGEHINVEDAIRCAHTLSWLRLTIYSATVETIRIGMSMEGTGMTVRFNSGEYMDVTDIWEVWAKWIGGMS